MFINNWYAACIGRELAQAPLRVRILDCDLVLFRDRAGMPHCLSDACCHRGASLAAGQRRDDLLICPQHGWEYDGSGRCVRVPAGIKDPAAPPRKARVPAYPVEERYGLLFVFLGDLDEAERGRTCAISCPSTTIRTAGMWASCRARKTFITSAWRRTTTIPATCTTSMNSASGCPRASRSRRSKLLTPT